MKKMQYPRHHHRQSRERQSLYRVDQGLIKEIISQTILIKDDNNAKY